MDKKKLTVRLMDQRMGMCCCCLSFCNTHQLNRNYDISLK